MCENVKARRGRRWQRERRAIARTFGPGWDKPGYTYTKSFRERGNADTSTRSERDMLILPRLRPLHGK